MLGSSSSEAHCYPQNTLERMIGLQFRRPSTWPAATDAGLSRGRVMITAATNPPLVGLLFSSTRLMMPYSTINARVLPS